MSNISYPSTLSSSDLVLALAGREEWKYSNLRRTLEGDFVLCKAAGRPSDELRSHVPNTTGITLVFVNGCFRKDMSDLGELPTGVTLTPMASAAGNHDFGRLASMTNSPFTEMNLTQSQDGIYLELATDTVLENSVNIIHLTDGDVGGSFLAPRHLIVAQKGSKATIAEYYTSCNSNNGDVLSLPVTEIFCDDGTDINHLKIIQENSTMHHLGSTHVHQKESSRFSSQEFALNGGSVRRELHLQLAGGEASCDLKALSMGLESQQVDMRTRVDHLVAGCNTNELYKGILTDQSRGIFDGLIKVARDAQQTSAHQTNRTLILSDDAVSYSIPRLEIYADDVKCSHGSTTGQLEDEQIFFLRSRGFTEEKARAVLASAFAKEIVMGVDDPLWRKVLDMEISKRLTLPPDGSNNHG